jgi:hypothetical protein
MRHRTWFGIASGVAILLVSGLFAFAQEKGEKGEKGKEKTGDAKERKVTEADVPKPALEALKKLAAGASITELAEEEEHGHKFYEASWTGPGGKVDALVTDTGDVIEIEEATTADHVPALVRAAAEKDAGKDAKIQFEKKTAVQYEAHYQKDGKGHELVLTPDGRKFQEGGEKDEKDDDDDDGGK